MANLCDLIRAIFRRTEPDAMPQTNALDIADNQKALMSVFYNDGNGNQSEIDGHNYSWVIADETIAILSPEVYVVGLAVGSTVLTVSSPLGGGVTLDIPVTVSAGDPGAPHVGPFLVVTFGDPISK